jgi:DNA-binding transcriptional MerR regulator
MVTDHPNTGLPPRPPLRVNNVARRLKLTPRMIRHLASTGIIPAFKLDGKSWGFLPEDIKRYEQIREARHAWYAPL